MSDDIRTTETRPTRTPWNKGKLTGPKPPLKVREIWAMRIRLQLAERLRDLALFNLAIDSKLRCCDLVALRVRDVAHGGTVAHRAIVLRHKTQQPVQFEPTDQTHESIAAWIAHAQRRSEGFPFASRVRQSPHLTSRQYARLVNRWVAMVALDPADYGTHSLRRTTATLIYRGTKNLRAVQLLLGHRKDLRAPSNTLALRSRTRWRFPSRPRCREWPGVAIRSIRYARRGTVRIPDTQRPGSLIPSASRRRGKTGQRPSFLPGADIPGVGNNNSGTRPGCGSVAASSRAFCPASMGVRAVTPRVCRSRCWAMGRGLRIQPLTRSDWQRTGFSQRVYAGLDDRMGRDERHAATSA